MKHLKLLVAICLLLGMAGIPTAAASPGPAFPGGSAGDWAAVNYDPGRTSDNAAETLIGPKNVKTLHVAWHVPLTVYPIQPTLVAAGGLLVMTNQKELVAFDAATGRVRWRVPAPNLGSFADTGLLVANGTVYAEVQSLYTPQNAGAAVVAYDLRTGKLRWKTIFTVPIVYIAGPLAYGGGRIYLVTDQGQAVALNPANGHLLWLHTYARWRIPRSFTYYKDRLYSTPFDISGSINVYSPETGRYFWSTESDSYNYPIVRDDKIYTTTGDEISASPSRCPTPTCKPLWTHANGGTSILAITERLIVEHVSSSPDFFIAERSATTGRQLWRTPAGARVGTSVVVAGRVIYATGDNFIQAYPLYGCGHPTCRAIWTRYLPTPDDNGETTFPVISHGTVYVGTENHGIWAFRP